MKSKEPCAPEPVEGSEARARRQRNSGRSHALDDVEIVALVSLLDEHFPRRHLLLRGALEINRRGWYFLACGASAVRTFSVYVTKWSSSSLVSVLSLARAPDDERLGGGRGVEAER